MTLECRVVAIVAAYNEADIIAQVVADLIDQGVQVYVLDDGSTDGTAAAVAPMVGRGVLAIEPLRQGRDSSPDEFDWERILRRKSEVASEIDADWFIHHDADEFRESPWLGVSLRDAIAQVDAAGCDAIDFASFDFWPTHDRFRPGDDVRAAFTRYAPRPEHDRVQVRAWKQTGGVVDLASTGGHDAQFAGRRVFPLRFISRHYPIRGQAHGERKVFQERLRRFRATERGRGWHVQYDRCAPGMSFLHDPATLTPYDPVAVRSALALRHRGVEALEAALDDARTAADRYRQDLAARTRDVEWLREKLSEAREHLAHRDAETGALRSELTRTARDLAAATESLAEARRAADEAGLTIARQQADIARLHDAASRVERAAGDARREVEALHRSFSWRLTAPARAVARALWGR
jgi:hypothetical protein